MAHRQDGCVPWFLRRKLQQEGRMSYISGTQGYGGAGHYSAYGGNTTGNSHDVQSVSDPQSSQHIGGQQCQCEHGIGDEDQQPHMGAGSGSPYAQQAGHAEPGGGDSGGGPAGSGSSDDASGGNDIMELLKKLLQALLGQTGANGGSAGNGLDGIPLSQPQPLTI
jgi:hypothetical protein